MSGEQKVNYFSMAWFDSCIDKLVCGRDADKLLPYPSVRYVSIQDRRLGLLYYIFLITIILYILVYVLLLQKGYLLRTTPVGTVRTTLQAPEAQFLKPPEQLEYCGNGTYRHNGVRLPQYQCRYLPSDFLVFPSLEQSALLVTSRIVDQRSVSLPGCQPPLSPGCLLTSVPVNISPRYFAAQMELYTLLIDHAFSAAGETRNSHEMDGILLSPQGALSFVDICSDYAPGTCPSYLSVGQGKPDIVPLNALLRAANVNLEEQSDHDPSAVCAPNTNCVGESRRSAGVMLLFSIEYSNTYTFNLNTYRYTYHVERIQGTEFKTLQFVSSDSNGGNSTVYNRHGVRIIFVHTGAIGAFDFQTLLISLVSSTGLLAAATFLVDCIMQWCMPDRKVYRQYKYLTTVDFSDFRDGLVGVDTEQQDLRAKPMVDGARVDPTTGELVHPDDPEKQKALPTTSVLVASGVEAPAAAGADGISPRRRMSFTELQIRQQLSESRGGGVLTPTSARTATANGGGSVELMTHVGNRDQPPPADASPTSQHDSAVFHAAGVNASNNGRPSDTGLNNRNVQRSHTFAPATGVTRSPQYMHQRTQSDDHLHV